MQHGSLLNVIIENGTNTRLYTFDAVNLDALVLSAIVEMYS